MGRSTDARAGIDITQRESVMCELSVAIRRTGRGKAPGQPTADLRLTSVVSQRSAIGQRSGVYFRGCDEVEMEELG